MIWEWRQTIKGDITGLQFCLQQLYTCIRAPDVSFPFHILFFKFDSVPFSDSQFFLCSCLIPFLALLLRCTANFKSFRSSRGGFPRGSLMFPFCRVWGQQYWHGKNAKAKGSGGGVCVWAGSWRNQSNVRSSIADGLYSTLCEPKCSNSEPHIYISGTLFAINNIVMYVNPALTSIWQICPSRQLRMPLVDLSGSQGPYDRDSQYIRRSAKAGHMSCRGMLCRSIIRAHDVAESVGKIFCRLLRLPILSHTFWTLSHALWQPSIIYLNPKYILVAQYILGHFSKVAANPFGVQAAGGLRMQG